MTASNEVVASLYSPACSCFRATSRSSDEGNVQPKLGSVAEGCRGAAGRVTSSRSVVSNLVSTPFLSFRDSYLTTPPGTVACLQTLDLSLVPSGQSISLE